MMRFVDMVNDEVRGYSLEGIRYNDEVRGYGQ
jgi:hypothetical protein